MAVTVIQQTGNTPNTYDKQVFSIVLTVSNTSSNPLKITYPLLSNGQSPYALGNTSGFTYQDYTNKTLSPFSIRHWVINQPYLHDYHLNMTIPPFPASSQGVSGVDYEPTSSGFLSILGNKKLSFVFSFAPNSKMHNLDETYESTFRFVNHEFIYDQISVTLKANYRQASFEVSSIDGAEFDLISHVVGVPKSGLNNIS